MLFPLNIDGIIDVILIAKNGIKNASVRAIHASEIILRA